MKTKPQKIIGDLLVGLLFACVILVGGLLFFTMQGWVVFTWPEQSLLISAWNWTYLNLKESIFVFFITFILWIKTMHSLHKKLASDKASAEQISHLESLVDIQAGVFFGIGVIFTAIGMRSALMESLGGIDAGEAGQLNAFVMLQRLVDGGILLALSTTIVGGVGGYIMRVAKSIVLGQKLQSYYKKSFDLEQQLIANELSDIKEYLKGVSEQMPVATQGPKR